MNKKLYLILMSTFLLASCGSTSSNDTASLTASTNDTSATSETTSYANLKQKDLSATFPAGTPALGLANYLGVFEGTSSIADATGLAAEFAKGKNGSDIVVAPVNLGAKAYATSPDYRLFKTFVWGNLYVISKDETVKTFTDLEGKTVGLFGTKSATPTIVMKALASYNKINVTTEIGASTAAEMTALYSAGTYSTIVTAEPVLSALKVKGVVNDSTTIIDLQEEYKKMNGTSSYPQAGIFVKGETLDKYGTNFDVEFDKMKEAVLLTGTNAEQTVTNAKKLSCFSETPAPVLTKAIPGSHFGLTETKAEEISSIESYFDILNEQGLSASYGGKKPSKEFYI